MKKITLLLAGSALLLSGCAGVKSSFDCDATTSDTCMTMTKANQLARDKAAKQAGKPAAGGLPSLVNLPATSAVGVPSASRSAVNPPSGTRTVSTTPPVQVLKNARSPSWSRSGCLTTPCVRLKPLRSTPAPWP